MSQELVERRIADLRENPRSVEIYGADDISDLLESIPMKGILVPLVVKPDGTIVSGHRRYRAAKKLFEDGVVKSDIVPCRVVLVEGDLEEKDLIITYNKQRNKTYSQMMREAEALEEIEATRAKERQVSKLNIGLQAPLGSFEHNGDESGRTRDSVADKVGIGSGATFQRARKVWEVAQAGDEGAKALVGKLDGGEVSVNKAYQLVRREEKVRQKKEEMGRVKAAPVLPSEELLLGDCRIEMKKLGAGSVALVLTDVPFFIPAEMGMHRRVNPMKFDPALLVGSEELREFDRFDSEEEYFAQMREWMTEAVRVLKPGGHLVTFCDRLKITEFARIGESLGLAVRQPLYWVTTNPVPNADKRDFMSAVMSMVWLTKPTDGEGRPTFNYQLGQHPNYFQAPYVPGTKEMRHPAEKPVSVLKEIISYLSDPGDVVLDPFAGSASTLVAAAELNRKPIGIEKSEFFYKLAARRMAAKRAEASAGVSE